MSISIKVLGPYRGISGYDLHTRSFVRSLVNHGAQVQMEELRGWSEPLHNEQDVSFFDNLRSPINATVKLHFVMPHQFKAEMGMVNVHYTMFEADRIPQNWVNIGLNADHIVLPTEAARDAWDVSGYPSSRLHVSPFGVDASIFNRMKQPLPLKVGDRPLETFPVRFLNVCEPRPRKNLMGLLRAWLRATKSSDDAVLILKLNCSPDMLSRFLTDVSSIESEEQRFLRDAAPIIVIPHRVTSDDMASIYSSATHYISMSHGEGWDFPMMEAAATGLELIAPRHTAYLTYLQEEDAHWIPSPLVPATFPYSLGAEDEIFFRGLNWWEPDTSATVEVFRTIIDGCPPKPPPTTRIAQQYTWAAAGRKLLDILERV
jgi:glycosyltransferase involved in cell wall biosynthesis